MPDLPVRLHRAIRPLSDQERRRSITRTLAESPDGDAVWVFAYGSLIWDPCFAFDSKETATLAGYRRAFNFWSVMSRGTPEKPGLGLGLEEGGSCEGIVYRLSRASLDRDLQAIWAREMYSDVYAPRWLAMVTPTGARSAVAFVTNTGHEQYAGPLAGEDAARIIAGARGEKGSCRDYLAAAIAALAAHGIDDPALTALLPLVDRHARG